MSQSDLHPHVQFATRYGDDTSEFLNAWVTIYRLESLVEDAVRLKDIFEREDPPERRWAPYYGAEIVSYYAVGLVTCLEWHARSRIADMFTYKPEHLRPEDLKGQVGEKIIAQLLAKGASVAHLIAAATSVGSLAKYLAILDRAFAAVGAPIGARASLITSDDKYSPLEDTDFASLEQLFAFRHDLVHEVGIQVVGHPNIRESWGPDEAVRMTQLGLRAVRKIEAGLTRYAPPDFPNLLTEQGLPSSVADRLTAEIHDLEARIGQALRAHDDYDGEKAAAEWTAAAEFASKGLDAELAFVDGAYALHFRYLDLKTPLKLQLLASRSRFLRRLLTELGDVPAAPEAGLSEAP